MNSENKNNKVARFGHVIYAPELPALYNQGLSDYEILVRLAAVINNNANLMESWVALADELEKVLADIDDTVKEKVIEAIQALYDSGELAEIVESIIDERLKNVPAPKEFVVDTRREFRIALYSMPYDAQDYNNLNYSYNQGGNYFVKDGVLHYVGCYRISTSRNLYYKNDNADIRLYAYLGGKWQFLRNQIYSVGHANDIRYIAHLNKFFIVKSAEFNGTSTETGTYDVCVADWQLPAQLDATFTIPSETIFPQRDRITCIDYFDDKFWVMIGSGGVDPVQIYTCDIAPETYVVSNFTEYDVFYIPKNAGTTYTMQGAGFCQNEDFIFLGNTAPAGIYRYNKHSNKIDCFYKIGAYSNAHMFPTGEVENLSIVDNEIFIGTAIHGNQRLSYFDYNQIFSFDYVNGSCANKVITTYGAYNRIIYVGMEGFPENTDYYTREISNPNGLIGDNGEAFPTWEECALFINAQDLWTTLEIVPLTKNIAGYFCLDLGKCNIYINGANYYNSSTASSELDKYPRVAGVYVEGGSLDMTRLYVANRAPEAAGDYAKYQIYSRFNLLNVHACALIPYLRPAGSKLVNVNRGFANLGTIYTLNGDTVEWTTDNLESYICSINTHNHWAGGTGATNIIG